MASRRSIGNYFRFRWMITPDILRIIYVLGTIFLILLNIALVIGSIIALVIFTSEIGLDTAPMIAAIIGIIILGLILLLITNLLFRMYCEQIILFFSMHEIMEDISMNTEPAGKMAVKGKKMKKKSGRKVELDWSDDDDD